MTNDPQYNNMPLVAAFLKAFTRAYLGPQTKEGDAPETLPDDLQELIPVEVQKKMRELFVSYFEGASKTLVKGQTVSFHSLPLLADCRNFLNKISVTTRRTSSSARSLRTGSMRTSE
jgi:hypothetical protein